MGRKYILCGNVRNGGKTVTMRDSINNLIRSDKPESPTDVIFLFGSLMLIAMQTYATLKQIQVPHFEVMLLALGGYKTVKVAGSWSRKEAANVVTTQDVPVQQ